MERAYILIGAIVGIVTVIEPDRAERQFIAETDADRVTHVLKPGRNRVERIGRIRQEITGVEENRAEKFPVNREDVFDVEDREKLAPDGMPVVMRTEVALGEAADGGAAAVEKAFVDRDVRDPVVAIE